MTTYPDHALTSALQALAGLAMLTGTNRQKQPLVAQSILLIIQSSRALGEPPDEGSIQEMMSEVIRAFTFLRARDGGSLAEIDSMLKRADGFLDGSQKPED